MGRFRGRPRRFTFRSPRSPVQIRELEANLGGPVVERESRGVVLTRLGREAFEQTLRVLDETSLLGTLGNRKNVGPARVVVGMLPTLAPYLLPGIVERLEGCSPRVEINIVESPGETLVSELLANRLDAAILSSPLGMREVREHELFEDRLLLAGFCRTAGTDPAHVRKPSVARRSGTGEYRAAADPRP